MSFDVLIVPEDFTYNGYILGPLVKRMLSESGRPNAIVIPPKGPQPKGYEHAKALLRTRYFDLYRHMNLLLFLPDADGKDRSAEFRSLEEEADRQGVRLLCCAAKEEVEVWLLAGHRDCVNPGRRFGVIPPSRKTSFNGSSRNTGIPKPPATAGRYSWKNPSMDTELCYSSAPSSLSSNAVSGSSSAEEEPGDRDSGIPGGDPHQLGALVPAFDDHAADG